MPKKITERVKINPYRLSAELRTRGMNRTSLRHRLCACPNSYIKSNETIKLWNKIGWPPDRYKQLLIILEFSDDEGRMRLGAS